MTLELSLVDVKANIQAIKKAAQNCYPGQPILRDLTICQAILESGLTGRPSILAYKYNNLFGIKGEGTAGHAFLPTHEYINGQARMEAQAFAWNNTLEDSINQHKKVLELPRYQPVRDAQTFNAAAIQIQKCGYATDPNYPRELIDIYIKYIPIDSPQQRG